MVDPRTQALVAPASAEILKVASNPVEDAANERARATFSSQEVAEFLRGAKRLKRRKELINILESKPWADQTKRYFYSREEEYVGGLKAATGLFKLVNDSEVSLQDALELRTLVFWPGGLELHLGMFIPTIQSQGTKEQKALWLPQCANLRMIGTYAQTELGHGTFVRGIETIAVHDPETQEFVIHSPNLTSTKWWPGGLARTSNTVVLMARLFTQGKDRGMHAFVVPIRDYDTHKPRPGVTVGDIGPKFGYNGVDNGFLQFNHVRIPAFNLLSRYARVMPDGTYNPPPPANSKASYATMVYVRSTIVNESGEFLSRAATIATRYTAVRRQTAAEVGQKELQVLDYDNVTQSLLPIVARSYGLLFAGKSMMAAYEKFDADRQEGTFDSLPDLHATSSGLKAASSNAAAAGIEVCRRSCGGHGYSLLSGLPTLFSSYVQNVTWEGDNNVMYLQLARYLVKKRSGALKPGASTVFASAAAADANDGSFAEPWSTAYLSAGPTAPRSSAASPACWAKPDVVLRALRHIARRQTDSATKVLLAASNGKLVFSGLSWNNSTVDLIRAAAAHSSGVLHAGFVAAIESADLSGPAKEALRTIVSLHGVTLLLDHEADLLHDGYVSGEQADYLRAAARQLAQAVRPNALAFVDAFAHEDYTLRSALGVKSGDVYASLLKAAQVSPLNDTVEGPAWEAVIKPAREELKTGLLATLSAMVSKM